MAERRLTADEVDERYLEIIRDSDRAGETLVFETGVTGDFAVIRLDRLRALEDDVARRQLREAWETYQEAVGDRNSDLSEDEVEKLANRFSEEFVAELFAEGKVRYRDVPFAWRTWVERRITWQSDASARQKPAVATTT